MVNNMVCYFGVVRATARLRFDTVGYQWSDDQMNDPNQRHRCFKVTQFSL